LTKREVLDELSFGERVAEDEGDALASYFVETELWRRIFAGQIDVIYGAKGAGKSAIYSLLRSRSAELEARQIVVITAENPRGNPAFRQLVADPPASETEFIALWKLYFATLLGQLFRERNLAGAEAKKAIDLLVEAELLQATSLQGFLIGARDYVRRMSRPGALEAGVALDPTTGTPSAVTGKITLSEPDRAARALGRISIDSVLALIDQAFQFNNTVAWLLLDRLDVAFLESQELEKNALRALFRVYRDLQAYRNVALKIFLRTDIRKRIAEGGFAELSHVTRVETIRWDQGSLMNLILRRALKSNRLRAYYGVEEQEVLADVVRQDDLLYRILPEKVDPGKTTRKSFSWILSRAADGSDETAPRELIHFFSTARNLQLRRFELGHNAPPGEALFDGSAIKGALPEVSAMRVDQTLFAEYPRLRPFLDRLRGEKAEQTLETLIRLWGTDETRALETATALVDAGVFVSRGESGYWVPFLYRHGLGLVQGKAAEAE
jgi:hypothetical protein